MLFSQTVFTMSYRWMQYLFALSFCIGVGGSCTAYPADEEDPTPQTEKEKKESGNTYRLSFQYDVQGGGTVRYPLWAYVFTEQGTFVKRGSIPSAEAQSTLSLRKGKYQVCLLSGWEETHYTLPLEWGYQSFFTFKEDTYDTYPLAMGRASVTLDSDVRMNATLRYVVASVQCSFTDLPTDTKAVSVSIHPVSAGLAFDGTPHAYVTTRSAPCRKQGDGTWRSERLYIFPSEGKKPVISVQVQTDRGTSVYSMTYSTSLETGTHYHIKGAWGEKGLVLDDTTITDWEKNIEIEFPFQDEQPITPSPNDKPTIKDEEAPETGKFWKGCYVWKTTTIDAKTYRAFLLCPQEWQCLASEGENLLTGYTHEGLSGWYVPTKEEAKEFQTLIYPQIVVVNLLLEAQGQEPLAYGKTSRYLCNDMKSSFHLSGTTVSAVGKSTQYRLRPFLEVEVEL